jgi:three-Cys-motif partner protein
VKVKSAAASHPLNLGEGEVYVASGSPISLSPEKYELDPEDGLPVEIVGPWALEKYHRLRRYIEISGIGVRRRWLGRQPKSAGASYVDLFSGPGRVRIRGSDKRLDAGPLIAWKQSLASNSPFTACHIADANPVLADAARTRLAAAGAPVTVDVGEARQTIARIEKKLNPYALHFAFLDPYSLRVLDFNIIRRLAAFKRMDILIHVSVQDLNRNLRSYVKKDGAALDVFAPGWRAKVDIARPDYYVRGCILEHWRSLLAACDMSTAETAELVSGQKRQPLYWLAFAARHPTALHYWEEIRRLDGQRQPELL